MAPVSGTLGRFYSHGTVVEAFENEVCGSLLANSYQIDDVTLRWWRPESPITVATASGELLGTAPSSAYTRRDLGGVIEFKAAIPEDSTVLVSGTAYPMTHIGGFKSWSFDISRDALDVTRQGVAWQEFLAGQGGAEASVDGFWIDDFFIGTVDPSVKWLAVFYADYAAGKRYEAQTYVTSNGISTEASGVAEESVSFRCTEAPRYYGS